MSLDARQLGLLAASTRPPATNYSGELTQWTSDGDGKGVESSCRRALLPCARRPQRRLVAPPALREEPTTVDNDDDDDANCLQLNDSDM